MGDIEVDLLIGKDNKSASLVTTDRTTLRTPLKKLTGKHATQVKKALIQTLKKVPYSIKNLIFDNDMVISQQLQVGKAFGAETFFTRPYIIQDQGTDENRIGVIRRFFPTKTDPTHVTVQDVNHVEKLKNNRPDITIKYKTSYQKLLD